MSAALAPEVARLELLAATPDAWFRHATGSLGVLLVDHANCEKKAASTALGLMFAYADDSALGLALARLAREELRHYEQVVRLLEHARVPYARLAPGRYAGELRKAIATGEPARRLDLLVVGALIEMRSCERFRGLAPRLAAPLGEFYRGLEAAEARHSRLYLGLAAAYAGRAGLDLGVRFAALAALEADLATQPDPLFRFHSGPPGQTPGLRRGATPRA